MKIHYSPGPDETNTMSTERLRDHFLLSGLFVPGEYHAHYTDLDRMIVGAAMPTTAPLALLPDKATGTEFFLARREIGILNIGAPGAVKVGKDTYELGTLDCLYVGLGEKEVSFHAGAEGQAAFYFISTPAHAKYPTAVARAKDVRGEPIGDPTKANRRRINKYIHADGLKSCQLVMGCTEFEPGSVWNTMPTHVHSRRTEIYMYFDLGDQIAVHLLGEPQRTRHVVMRDREVVFSPAWSVHTGVGTGSYRFVWAMGGDNQVFTDMDPVTMAEIR